MTKDEGPPFVRLRLAVMMFLFYFALGGWAVTLSTFLMSSPLRGGLNFTTQEVGWVYSSFALAGLTAPLFVGLLADRLFRADRVLAVSAVASAGLLFAAGRWCDDARDKAAGAFFIAASTEVVDGRPLLSVADRARQEPAVRAALDRVNDHPAVRAESRRAFGPLFALMFGVCFCVQLGLTVTAVVALRNLPDPGHQFSRTRLFGTVGWMVAGCVVGLALTAVSPQPLYLCASAAALTGVYAFTLPRTPPKGTGKTLGEMFGLPAFVLFRDPSFVVFVLIAFTSSAMNQFYGVYAHRYLTEFEVRKPEIVLTLGQAVEVACMFAIPLLKPKERLKALMLLGLGGWVIRGAVMAYGWMPGVIALAVPMHGWSYTFYFIVAATYIDREALPHLRASAQAIVSFVASGAAPWAGNMLAAWVVDRHRVGTVIDWQAVWVWPLAGCAAAFVVFLVLFHEPKKPQG